MRLKMIDGRLVKDSDFEPASFIDQEEDLEGSVRLRRISRDERRALDIRDAREEAKARARAHARAIKRSQEEMFARSNELAQQMAYFRDVDAARRVVDMQQAMRAMKAEEMKKLYGARIFDQNSKFRVDRIDDWSDYANRRAQEEAALDVPLDQLAAEYEARENAPRAYADELTLIAAQSVIEPNSAVPAQVPVAIVARSPRAASTFNPQNPLLSLAGESDMSFTDIIAAIKRFFTVTR